MRLSKGDHWRNSHPAMGRTAYVMVDSKIENRASQLELRGFKAYDALHIAAAESAVADYFCTCDDRLLLKAKFETDLAVKVRSPLGLAQEIFS